MGLEDGLVRYIDNLPLLCENVPKTTLSIIHLSYGAEDSDWENGACDRVDAEV